MACSTFVETVELPELTVPRQIDVGNRFELMYLAPPSSSIAIHQSNSDTKLEIGKPHRIAQIVVPSSAGDRVLYSKLYSVEVRLDKNELWRQDADFLADFRSKLLAEEREAASKGWRLVSRLGKTSETRLGRKTWLCGDTLSELSETGVAGYRCYARAAPYAAVSVSVAFGKPVRPESRALKVAIEDVHRIAASIEILDRSRAAQESGSILPSSRH